MAMKRAHRATAAQFEMDIFRAVGDWVCPPASFPWDIDQLRNVGGRRHELQVANALSNRDPNGMGEDQAGKANGAALPLVRHPQHVGIEGEPHAIQLGSAIEQCRVVLPSAAIVLRGQDIDGTNRSATVIEFGTCSSM